MLVDTTQKRLVIRWKPAFLTQTWYLENPAHKYLNAESINTMLVNYILGLPDDADSEAEVFVEETK